MVVTNNKEVDPNVKLQRLLYLLHGVLPLLEHICTEQDSEIGIEAKIHGVECAEVDIIRAQLGEDERRYWYGMLGSTCICVSLCILTYFDFKKLFIRLVIASTIEDLARHI